MAQSSGFLLGMDYSETAPVPLSLIVWAPIAADAAGELYIQSICTMSGVVSACITKLSADGQTILWQQTGAGFSSTMAVDPSGAVYLAWGNQSASAFVVEKLSPDGATVVTPINYEGMPNVAADFSLEGIKANILDSQRNGQKYRDFTRRAMESGVQGYFAFLRGHRVTYFGRQGDQHTEWFPGASPKMHTESSSS